MTISDSLGHSIGDKLLVEVGERLLSVCGDKSVVRFSGDEFAVLIEGDHATEEARPLAAKIVQSLEMPFEMDGRIAFVGVCIGLAKGPADYQRPEEPLRDSDIAMYHAKDQGIALVEFDREMHSKAVELHRMETELRFAIDERQFVVFYQPIVDLTRKRIYGFEALVRWKHPERGFVSPFEFIPVAESTGLIIPLTEQILFDACRKAAEWNEISPTPLTMSVNISGKHFESPSLIELLESTLNETLIDPRLLKLEITESAIMNNADAAIRTLHRIRSMGMNISVDDFGTGYSSLSYLQRFPIDTLKIDRSFVSASETGKENGAIVRTIVSLAKALGLSIVAEGIETEEQFRILRSLGCDFGQGYLFAKPLPENEIFEMITGARPIEFLTTAPDPIHYLDPANIDHIDQIQ